MTTVLTVINVVLLIVMAFIAFAMWQMMNSFAEIIVKFVEQNQQYYKSQKHLVQKSNELADNMKKLQTVHTSLKRVTSRLESASKLKRE